jgi:predicted trehalose synthase
MRLRVRNGARGDGNAGVEEGVLIDGGDDPRTGELLLDVARRKRRLRGTRVEIAGERTRELKARLPKAGQPLDARPARADQSNTSWRIGDRLMLKLYRRVEEGTNPELEISRHLARKRFAHVPAFAGHIDMELAPSDTATRRRARSPSFTRSSRMKGTRGRSRSTSSSVTSNACSRSGRKARRSAACSSR